MAGLFFTLHLLRVQGFYFYPAAYQPHTSVHSGFSAINAIIQPKHQKPLQGFVWAFLLI